MTQIADLFGRLDPTWIDHGRRVGELAEAVGHAFDLDTPTVADLVAAARLHDVGKADIDHALLTKPAALSDAEWLVVRTHPQIGFEAVRGSVNPAVAQMVLYHHERFDGGGYPYGLSGERIPLGARILAVIDAFDAMVSDRPYCRPRSVEEALCEMRRCAGTQFDPEVVTVVDWALTRDLAGLAIA